MKVSANGLIEMAAKGKVAIVPVEWLTEITERLGTLPHVNGSTNGEVLDLEDNPEVLDMQPRSRGIYKLTGKVKDVRGRETIKAVFNHIKAAGKAGAQVGAMAEKLKMPSSTIYFALKKLSDKGAIERG